MRQLRKEAVTKVIDTLTQEDFDEALHKLLERYNKCISARGDYFEGDKSFMCVLSIIVPIRRKSEKLFNDPRKENSLIVVRKIPFHKKLNMKQSWDSRTDLLIAKKSRKRKFVYKNACKCCKPDINLRSRSLNKVADSS